MSNPSPAPPEPTARSRVAGAYHAIKERYQRSPRLQRMIWQHRIAPAFWTIASLLSLAVNIFLIVALLIVGRQLFTLRTAVDKQLLTGLYDNFALMDQAHIVTTISVETTIQVQDTIPVVFDLPLTQDTEVVLTQDTPIEDVSILLNGVWIPTNIVLPAGTPQLPVRRRHEETPARHRSEARWRPIGKTTAQKSESRSCSLMPIISELL